MGANDESQIISFQKFFGHVRSKVDTSTSIRPAILIQGGTKRELTEKLAQKNETKGSVKTWSSRG
jgi:hypothetical protein